MVFGFFTRKATQPEPELPPSPITDASDLYKLISSVPPQTLHTYTLTHLSPSAPSPFALLSLPLSTPTPISTSAPTSAFPLPPAPPSPRTLTALTNFFTSLTPPPKLHCVRCHASFFELENDDRACRVPHDDESAVVLRVGAGTPGYGALERSGAYETLWGCCARLTEGDGDQGPPDGWCYEGMHTTDSKRARFRADSTPTDDKLVSCHELRCGLPPVPKSRSPRRARKRSMRTMLVEHHRTGTDIDHEHEYEHASPGKSPPLSIASSSRPIKGRKTHRKSESLGSTPTSLSKPKSKTRKRNVRMDVDSPHHSDTDAAQGTDAECDKPPPAKRPRHPQRKKSVLSPAFVVVDHDDVDAMDVDQDAGPSTPPTTRSSLPTPAPSLRSPPVSTSKGKARTTDTKTKTKSTTKTKTKTSGKTRARQGAITLHSEDGDEVLAEEEEKEGGKATVRRTGRARAKAKALDEVVKGSVEGEEGW